MVRVLKWIAGEIFHLEKQIWQLSRKKKEAFDFVKAHHNAKKYRLNNNKVVFKKLNYPCLALLEWSTLFNTRYDDKLQKSFRSHSVTVVLYSV